MKVKMLELEAGRGNCDVDALAQIRDMRAHIEVGFFTAFFGGGLFLIDSTAEGQMKILSL